MTMKTTGNYTRKPYECTECGREEEIGTNHWGECYPFCRSCHKQTTWKCNEPAPAGYGKPMKWKRVKLGDIVEIKKGVKLKR